jgi:hypothetical protein
MIYQLPSGKVINISTEAHLRMTDDDFKYMEERNAGSTVGAEFTANNFDVTEDALEEVDIIDDIVIEIDITTLDTDLFVFNPDTSEE